VSIDKASSVLNFFLRQVCLSLRVRFSARTRARHFVCRIPDLAPYEAIRSVTHLVLVLRRSKLHFKSFPFRAPNPGSPEIPKTFSADPCSFSSYLSYGSAAQSPLTGPGPRPTRL